MITAERLPVGRRAIRIKLTRVVDDRPADGEAALLPDHQRLGTFPSGILRARRSDKGSRDQPVCDEKLPMLSAHRICSLGH